MEYSTNDFKQEYEIAQKVFDIEFSNYRHMEEDMIQNAVIELWHNKWNFDPQKSSYETYAKRICRNAMIDTIRKEKRHIKHDVSMFEEIGDAEQIIDVLEAEHDPDAVAKIEQMAFDILNNDVKSIMKKYDKRTKKIIEMYLNRRTFDEIAHYVRLSKSTVHQYVQQFRDAVIERRSWCA